MSFSLKYMPQASIQYDALKARAQSAATGRKTRGEKSSKDEGLFKQINKTIQFLQDNPKHPGLRSHEFDSMTHPFDPKGKVWESYVQNQTPGAYRIFWCYGPGPGEITVVAITPHP